MSLPGIGVTAIPGQSIDPTVGSDKVALRAAAWLFILSGIAAIVLAPLPKVGGRSIWMEIAGAAVLIVTGVGMRHLRGVHPLVLGAVPFAGVLGVSWYTWSAEPALGGHTFYLLPVAFSGMFLSRLNLALTVVAVTASFAVAVTFARDGHLRPLLWLAVTLVCLSTAVLVRFLRDRLTSVTGDLYRAATHDSLTGLLNRRGVADAVAAGADTSVVVFDLDHFKRLNDTHGHAAGDTALRKFAQILSQHSRGDDVIGRMGGEEFIAILPGCSAREACALADRVRREVKSDGGRPGQFTVSAGVATHGASASLGEAIKRADKALYIAKEGGRDRVVALDGPLAADGRRLSTGQPLDIAPLSWGMSVRATWDDLVSGAPRTALDRGVARRAGAALSLVGAALCATITATADVAHSYQAGLLWISLLMGGLGFALLAFRALEHIVPVLPLVAVAIASSILAMTDPYSGSLIYTAWPLLFTAYFFPPRTVAVTMMLAAVGMAVAFALAIERLAPVAMWANGVLGLSLITGLVLVIQTRIYRIHHRLAEHADTDSLTGLPNRRAFAVAAARALAEGPVAVAVFDIDHFKTINDRDGHDAGDAVLKVFAQALADGARGNDIIARHGGEEFVAALPGADPHAAVAFAERVCAAFGDASAGSGRRVTASAGVTLAEAVEGTDVQAALEDAVNRADQAMYAAKREGRDGVRIWVPTIVADGGGEPEEQFPSV